MWMEIIIKGGGGRLLGLLSGLRRPPDLGYSYRRILPQKVALCSKKTDLFYSSSQSRPIRPQKCAFGNVWATKCGNVGHETIPTPHLTFVPTPFMTAPRFTAE